MMEWLMTSVSNGTAIACASFISFTFSVYLQRLTDACLSIYRSNAALLEHLRSNQTDNLDRIQSSTESTNWAVNSIEDYLIKRFGKPYSEKNGEPFL